MTPVPLLARSPSFFGHDAMDFPVLDLPHFVQEHFQVIVADLAAQGLDHEHAAVIGDDPVDREVEPLPRVVKRPHDIRECALAAIDAAIGGGVRFNNMEVGMQMFDDTLPFAAGGSFQHVGDHRDIPLAVAMAMFHRTMKGQIGHLRHGARDKFLHLGGIEIAWDSLDQQPITHIPKLG